MNWAKHQSRITHNMCMKTRHFYVTYLTAVRRAVTRDRTSCLLSVSVQLLNVQIYMENNDTSQSNTMRLRYVKICHCLRTKENNENATILMLPASTITYYHVVQAVGTITGTTH